MDYTYVEVQVEVELSQLNETLRIPFFISQITYASFSNIKVTQTGGKKCAYFMRFVTIIFL